MYFAKKMMKVSLFFIIIFSGLLKTLVRYNNKAFRQPEPIRSQRALSVPP